MDALGWTLIYSDGSRFTDTDGAWAQAPETDVQVLILWHARPYVTLTYGDDLYRLEGEPAAKFGRYLPDEQWEALRLAVHKEVSAWR